MRIKGSKDLDTSPGRGFNSFQNLAVAQNVTKGRCLDSTLGNGGRFNKLIDGPLQIIFI